MTLDPPAHLDAQTGAAWVEVTTAYGNQADQIVGPDLEAYCGQIAILRDAQKRIATDGTVVKDSKGHPVPHPALQVAKSAQDEIRKWGPRFTPPRRR